MIKQYFNFTMIEILCIPRNRDTYDWLILSINVVSHHNLSGVEIIGEAPKLVWVPFCSFRRILMRNGRKGCWMADDFSMEKQVFWEYFMTTLTYRLYVIPASCRMWESVSLSVHSLCFCHIIAWGQQLPSSLVKTVWGQVGRPEHKRLLVLLVTTRTVYVKVGCSIRKICKQKWHNTVFHHDCTLLPVVLCHCLML